MSLAEYNALAERYQEEQERKDGRFALLCCLIANINRDPKKKPRPFKVEDFMPKKAEHKPEMTAEDMALSLKLINSALGGEEK